MNVVIPVVYHKRRVPSNCSQLLSFFHRMYHNLKKPFAVQSKIERSILTEAQKACFYAVWDADEFPRRTMTTLLQRLVDLDNRQVENEDGNEGAKDKILSRTQHHLLFKASNERRANVSQFITVLEGLSAEAMRDMLTMASVPEVRQDESDGSSILTG